MIILHYIRLIMIFIFLVVTITPITVFIIITTYDFKQYFKNKKEKIKNERRVNK